MNSSHIFLFNNFRKRCSYVVEILILRSDLFDRLVPAQSLLDAAQTARLRSRGGERKTIAGAYGKKRSSAGYRVCLLRESISLFRISGTALFYFVPDDDAELRRLLDPLFSKSADAAGFLCPFSQDSGCGRDFAGHGFFPAGNRYPQSITLRICCDFGYRSYQNPLEPCPKLRIMQFFFRLFPRKN